VSDDKFNKLFDLEPTEYRKSDAREPIFGFNAKDTLILFLTGLIVGPIAVLVVTGQFPYWLRSILE